MFKIIFVILALVGTYLLGSWFHLSGLWLGLSMAGVAVLGISKIK